MNSTQSGLPPRAKNAGKSRKKPVQKKKKSGVRSFFKFLFILILIAILGAASYAGYLYLKGNEIIESSGVDKPVAPGHSAKEKPITMLLLGTDHRPETGTYLTDVVMVVSMHPETNTATLVSLPRDTLVELEGYKANKLNAYYPRFKSAEKSSGISAEDEMKAMLGKYLDVNIDYVSVVDFQGFRDVVDAFGGVDVNVQYNMCYKDSADGTNIDLKAGPQKLDGKEALDYVRYRKSSNKCSPRTKESNDFERNARQSEVLHSLLDRMKSLGGVARIGNALDAVKDNLKTDLEQDQIRHMITTYLDIRKDDVLFMPVIGEWRSPYVIVSPSELEKAKQALKDELAGKHRHSESEGTEAENTDSP
ncbi:MULTISPECIES: LCP family protein [Paenibacillus]|uniref:Transcriptional regulator n=1 Tax=Paenibacillus campinasensis TaxID=66347 RepID=A0A268F4Q5_9BACL|nr:MULTISPECIES: LCP family protein [Paenibacillus]MUG64631.1 LytR family transcriptional regulator [Paenibacillus campinasensis]PAD80353.1 transcriptional regulator [Paenibacillus campinasensis]PAK55336.1 transcriptional regulator [Paenibacillus sp. 7541]